jgi:hypothetical protein
MMSLVPNITASSNQWNSSGVYGECQFFWNLIDGFQSTSVPVGLFQIASQEQSENHKFREKPIFW